MVTDALGIYYNPNPAELGVTISTAHSPVDILYYNGFPVYDYAGNSFPVSVFSPFDMFSHRPMNALAIHGRINSVVVGNDVTDGVLIERGIIGERVTVAPTITSGMDGYHIRIYDVNGDLLHTQNRHANAIPRLEPFGLRMFYIYSRNRGGQIHIGSYIYSTSGNGIITELTSYSMIERTLISSPVGVQYVPFSSRTRDITTLEDDREDNFPVVTGLVSDIAGGKGRARGASYSPGFVEVFA